MKEHPPSAPVRAFGALEVAEWEQEVDWGEGVQSQQAWEEEEEASEGGEFSSCLNLWTSTMNKIKYDMI